jgi:hypothetical protein
MPRSVVRFSSIALLPHLVASPHRLNVRMLQLITPSHCLVAMSRSSRATSGWLRRRPVAPHSDGAGQDVPLLLTHMK